MTATKRYARRPPAGLDDGQVRAVSAALACVNLVAVFIALNLVWSAAERNAYEGQVAAQDIWMPMSMVTWVMAMLNGAVLAAWPRSRQAGIGILLGAGGTVVVLVLFVSFSLMAMHQ